MKIEITRKFQKQVNSCNDQLIRKKVGNILEDAASVRTMSGFCNLKKLRGSKNSYRIRAGNYRIGLIIDDDLVIFAAFDHRSDIYKYFP